MPCIALYIHYLKIHNVFLKSQQELLNSILFHFWLLNILNILEINNKNNNADNKFQNYHQNLNNLQTITEIQNKDFDEIFQSVSGLYHKLLNIKIYRDLNLDLIGQSQNKYQNLSPNCLSNTLTNASNINTIPYLNQINDIKNNNFKEYDANISKNVDNYMNIPVVTEMKKDALSKVNEFNNVYIQNKN